MSEGALGGSRWDGAGQAEGPAASHWDPRERPSLHASAGCGDRPLRPGRVAGDAPGRSPGEPGRGDVRQLADGLRGRAAERRAEARRGEAPGDSGVRVGRGEPLNSGLAGGPTHPKRRRGFLHVTGTSWRIYAS